MRNLCALILTLLLASCSPKSPKEVRKKGEEVARHLVSQLQAIDSREELLHALPQLRKDFLKLADLAVEGHACLEEGPLPPVNSKLNQQLRQELVRIYALEGGRQMVEEAERDALNHLLHAELD